MPTTSCDLLITAIETNSHHGVGILLPRVFPDSKDFVCIRTTSIYNGEEPFGSAQLGLKFLLGCLKLQKLGREAGGDLLL